MSEEVWMSERPSPTVWHRRVTDELRRLREATERSAVDVALHMGWNRTKVNRIERGEWKRLNPQDVRALATYYGAGAEEQDALIEMATRAKHKGWWLQYTDTMGPAEYIGLEADASVLRTFEVYVIPGLLQTPEYHESGMHAVGLTDEVEIRTRVEVRQRRQKRLVEDHPLVLHALVDEGALWKNVGGSEVMAHQLRRIIEANRRPNIEVRIVPNDVGLHPGVHGAFVLMEFPFDSGTSAVFRETLNTSSISFEELDVTKYRNIYSQLWDLAMNVDESQARLQGIAHFYADRGGTHGD